MRIIGLFAAGVLGIATQAEAQSVANCLQPGDRISGELRIVETRHPNGQVMRSPFIVMPESRCIDDPALGRADGKWVQLAGDAAQAVKDIPAGSRVVAEARDWIVPHTAWHFGDFVANQTRLVGYELQ